MKTHKQKTHKQRVIITSPWLITIWVETITSSVAVWWAWDNPGLCYWEPHSSTLLPGKSHGRRSLVGCSPWGRSESDTTEWLHFQFSLSCIGEGNGNPLQCSCLENPRDGGTWWAAVFGVARSQTRLKWRSRGGSSCYLVSGSILPISLRQLDFDPNSFMSSNQPNLWDLETEPHPPFPGVSLCSGRLLLRVDSKSYLWSPFLSTPHWTLSLSLGL